MRILRRSEAQLIYQGQPVYISGEALLPGYGEPDFVVYGAIPFEYENGQRVADSEREAILQQFLSEAEEKGLKIRVDMPPEDPPVEDQSSED